MRKIQKIAYTTVLALLLPLAGMASEPLADAEQQSTAKGVLVEPRLEHINRTLQQDLELRIRGREQRAAPQTQPPSLAKKPGAEQPGKEA